MTISDNWRKQPKDRGPINYKTRELYAGFEVFYIVARDLTDVMGSLGTTDPTF
jgi:hypothetical protein